MIKLTNPLLHNGRMIPEGATVGGLDQSLEKALIAAGNAISCGNQEPLFAVGNGLNGSDGLGGNDDPDGNEDFADDNDPGAGNDSGEQKPENLSDIKLGR